MAPHAMPRAQAEAGADNSTGAMPPELTPIVDQPAMRDKTQLRPVILSVVCAIALVTAIAAVTSILLFDLRDRALINSERELKNTALILAEQSERAFQTLDLTHKSLIEQIQSRGITSDEDFARLMSGRDTHVML